MPYRTEWVDPEVFLTYGDVTVYHTYKHDDVEQGRMTYWYTTDEDGSIEGYLEGTFDVRNLAGWTPEIDHGVIIIAAIDRGDLPIKED